MENTQTATRSTPNLSLPHAVLLSGLLVSGALVFQGLSNRYELTTTNPSIGTRLDRLTGRVDICLGRQREERRADGEGFMRFTHYECAEELGMPR